MRVYTFSKNQDDVRKAVELYKSGKTTVEIAGILGKSRASISNYLKYANVSVQPYTPPRVIDLDERFFDQIDSERKSYWLGFLLADGYMAKRRIRLEVSSVDRCHVEKMLSDIGSTSRIREHLRGNGGNDTLSPSVSTLICSAHMCKSLEDMGWTDFKKKGDCRILESVPFELRHHLLRGLFDGDGSIIPEQGTSGWRLTFIDAHPDPVAFFQRHLIEMDPTIRFSPVQSVSLKSTAWVVKWSGRERVRRIRDCLYRGASVFLDRKKEKFIGLDD